MRESRSAARQSGYNRAVKVIAAAILAVVLFEGGCSSSSSTSPCHGSTSTLTVSVVDDTNEGENLCGTDGGAPPTVKASGPTQITLERTGGQGSCSYVGTVIAGTYDVTATAPEYQPGSSGPITVQAGCPAATQIDMMPIQ